MSCRSAHMSRNIMRVIVRDMLSHSDNDPEHLCLTIEQSRYYVDNNQRRRLSFYRFAALPVMARAAGESFIGSVKRRMPSYLYNALATAGAVGTRPISPTPFAP